MRVERGDEPVVLGDLAGVVAKELHRLGDIAQGLEPVLPDLVGEQGAELEHLGFHEVCRLEHHVPPTLPSPCLPLRGKAGGDRHRIVDVCVRRLGIPADHDAGVDR